MNSSSKNPLQRQQIATLVKGEVDGLQGIMKKMLANKIGFFEAQQQNIKQTTPGVSPMPSTTHAVNFMLSFKEQVDDIQLEIVDAPSNDTVRRVKALIALAKSNFPKLDSSDVKKALDMLLELAYYAVIDAPRTKGKGSKSYAIVSKKLVTATKGKAGDVRRYVQDIIIKGVYQLAGQFLHNADYPRNYEEMRDYFDLNEKGKAIAEKINKEKADIVADRERAIGNANNKAAAAAEAAVEQADKEQELAAQIAAADAARISTAKVNLTQEASAVFSQLGQTRVDATDAVILFAASMYKKPVDKVLGEIEVEDFGKILLELKEYAAQHKVPIREFGEMGKQLIPMFMQAIAEGHAIDKKAMKRLVLRPLDSLEKGLTSAEEGNVRDFQTFSRDEMVGYLQHQRPGMNWLDKYARYITRLNKDYLTKIYILEGLFTSNPFGDDDDEDNAEENVEEDDEEHEAGAAGAAGAAAGQPQWVGLQHGPAEF